MRRWKTDTVYSMCTLYLHFCTCQLALITHMHVTIEIKSSLTCLRQTTAHLNLQSCCSNSGRNSTYCNHKHCLFYSSICSCIKGSEVCALSWLRIMVMISKYFQMSLDWKLHKIFSRTHSSPLTYSPSPHQFPSGACPKYMIFGALSARYAKVTGI